MEFILAKNIEDAAAAAKKSAAKARVYFAAGATDLYVLMKEGQLAEPAVFIDLSRAAGINRVKETKKSVVIGSGATFSEIIASPVCRKKLGLLVKAARTVGSTPIRNRATVGGNIANSSPAGDSLPALAALDAVITARLGKTQRKIPAAEFFTGPKKNALKNGEIIESVEIPAGDFNFAAFLKIGSRRALAISKVSLAVAGRLENGVFSEIKIAAGAVGPTVIRCRRTEKLLVNSPLDDGAVSRAKQTIESEITPIDDFRSTAVYRREVAGALLGKILLAARGGNF